jgi:hypothetical protein
LPLAQTFQQLPGGENEDAVSEPEHHECGCLTRQYANEKNFTWYDPVYCDIHSVSLPRERQCKCQWAYSHMDGSNGEAAILAQTHPDCYWIKRSLKLPVPETRML